MDFGKPSKQRLQSEQAAAARALRDPPPEDSIAARLRFAREKYKLTRWSLSAAAQFSRGYYGRMEDWLRGYRNPSALTCRQVVTAYAKLGVRVSLDWLITGQGPAPTRIRNRPGWNQRAWKEQQAEEQRQRREKRKANART